MSIESVMPFNHLILCHPLLLLPSIFPASGSFPMSWLFTSGGQGIEALASASVLPMNIQGWFLLGLTGLVSLLSKELSESSLAAQLKHQFFSLLYCPTFTFIHSILLWFSQRTSFLICFFIDKVRTCETFGWQMHWTYEKRHQMEIEKTIHISWLFQESKNAMVFLLIILYAFLIG